MVAAALIPAAAAVGVGLAWRLPTVAFGALLLLVVSATAIALVGAVTFRAMDHYPGAGRLDTPGDSDVAIDIFTVLTGRRVVIAVLVVVFLAGLVPLAGQIEFERNANTAVQDVLADGASADLELVGVTASRSSMVPGGGRDTVAVTVNRPAAGPPPALADRIERRVERAAGRDVVVTVTFRETQSSARGE